MNVRILAIILSFCLTGTTFAQRTVFESTETIPVVRSNDGRSLSQIFLPIKVDLRPFFALAEKSVDTVFTSDNYPNGWIQEGCDLRYKYIFRRSPLSIVVRPNQIKLSFTGFYKIVGETRICIKDKVLSPWTPSCKCGFDEGERKVNVSMQIQFILNNNYSISTEISIGEPKPLNNCEVCFFGKNVTAQVMDGLKKKLVESKKELEQSYKLIDFKSKAQEVWKQLQSPFKIDSIGWLQLDPKQLYLQNFTAIKNSLEITLGMQAHPVFTIEKTEVAKTTIPLLKSTSQKPGFSVMLESKLRYDSLSNILNKQLTGQQFSISKGPIKKDFIIDSAGLEFGYNNRIKIGIKYSGSNKGYMELLGKPIYDSSTSTLQFNAMDFSISSDNKLLDASDWLFQKKIKKEITRRSIIKMDTYFDQAKQKLELELNKEWMPGLKGKGTITKIGIIETLPVVDAFSIKMIGEGLLEVEVSKLSFLL